MHKVGLTAAMAIATFAIMPGHAGAAPQARAVPTCQGKVATIVRGDASNLVQGTPRADVIVAGGGRDLIYAGGGRDTICGGDDGDQVHGGPGADTIVGGRSHTGDWLYGGPGADRFVGRVRNGLSADHVVPGPGFDTMHNYDAVVDMSGQATGVRIGVADPTDDITDVGYFHGTTHDDVIRVRDAYIMGWGGSDRLAGDIVCDGRSPADDYLPCDSGVGDADNDVLRVLVSPGEHGGSLISVGGHDRLIGSTDEDWFDTYAAPASVRSAPRGRSAGERDRWELMRFDNGAIDAAAQTVQYAGVPPTSVDGQFRYVTESPAVSFQGSDGNDVVELTGADSYANGAGGDDVIDASTADGGAGDDRISTDSWYSDSPDASGPLTGGPGHDRISSYGRRLVDGGSGIDTLVTEGDTVRGWSVDLSTDSWTGQYGTVAIPGLENVVVDLSYPTSPVLAVNGDDGPNRLIVQADYDHSHLDGRAGTDVCQGNREVNCELNP